MYAYQRYNLEYLAKHVSGPTPEPIAIADIHKALALEAENTSFDPDDLLAKASAARIEAEGVLGRKIGTQVWDLVLNFWPVNWCLPLEPVQSVNAIYWTDQNGVEHTADPSIYVFNAANNRLWLKYGYFWPDSTLLAAGGIRIQVTVGIPNDKIANNVRQAILLRTGTLAMIREDVTVGTVQQAAKVGTFEALLGATREYSI